MYNQKKGNNQFKNNKQPELSENQTAWNSNNQDVKETFIQISRRGGDGQPGGEDPWQGVERGVWGRGSGEIGAG